jgi:hypothetical protein
MMMEAASTSETSVTSTRLHGATTQKIVIFILAAVRTSNPIFYNLDNTSSMFVLLMILKSINPVSDRRTQKTAY